LCPVVSDLRVEEGYMQNLIKRLMIEDQGEIKELRIKE
jgi:hypothetical protein